MSINEAAESLKRHLGNPPWLRNVGIGTDAGRPIRSHFIHVIVEPGAESQIPVTWEGYRVKVN
jgi:hypothetical protein